MTPIRLLLAAVTCVVAVPASPADDPDAGSEQRFRGMISTTQVTCVAVADKYYGFGNALGGVSFHKREKQATAFRAFSGHRGAVTALAYNPDVTVLASAGADGAVRCWSVETIQEYIAAADKQAQDGFGRPPASPKPSLNLTGHTGAVHFVAFDKDGTRLASAGADGTVRLWDAKTGHSLKVMRGHRGAVKGVAFHPEGKRLASVGADKSLRVWDVHTGKQVRDVTGLAAPLECVAYSSDGSQIAVGGGTAGKSGLLKVFDATSGKELLSLDGHEDVVTGVTFHLSKPRLVSVSRDKTIRTWEMPGGKLLYRDKHREPILRLSLSPDGTLLGTATHEVIKLWDGNAEPPAGKEKPLG